MDRSEATIGPLVFLAFHLAFVGCSGNEKVDIHGNVTLDGKALLGGLVVFEPADRHGASVGGEISDGKYSLTDVPPGEKVVRITAVLKTGRQVEVGPPSPPGTMADEFREIRIPAIYNQNSKLKISVTSGNAHEHNFALNSK